MRLKKIKKAFIIIGITFLVLYCLYSYSDYKYNQSRILGEINIKNLEGYNIEIDRGARDDDWENPWVKYYFRINKIHSLKKENTLLDKIITENFIFFIKSDENLFLDKISGKFIDSIFFLKINYLDSIPYFFDLKTGIETYNNDDFLKNIRSLPKNDKKEKLDSVQKLRDSIQNYIKTIDKQNENYNEPVIKSKTVREPLITLGIILLLIYGLYKYLDYKYLYKPGY